MGIVRGHHGTIFIDSQLGRGSIFRVIFPVSERSAQVEGIQNNGNSIGGVGGRTGEGTILIIDDEPAIRDLVSTLVSSVGFAPITAHDGREGIAMFKENVADIVAVVVDRTMPEMNGEEVIREITRMQKDTRVIVSRGYLEDEWIQKIATGHDTTFIEKPYRPRAFLEKLREAF